jgi:hypothetical protein
MWHPIEHSHVGVASSFFWVQIASWQELKIKSCQKNPILPTLSPEFFWEILGKTCLNALTTIINHQFGNGFYHL